MSSLGVPTDQPVYVGIWTNWSRGKILGPTLTLTDRDGQFLIAFLALFVTFVGTCFFRVTSFLLHTAFSHGNIPNDAIYHQRQAVLRNSPDGMASVWTFSQLSWHWRQRNSLAFRRFLPFLLHGALCSAAFAVAGIFSSRVAALSGDEVLVSSPRCGHRGPPDEETQALWFELFGKFTAQRMNAVVNYVQDCYTHDNSSVKKHCNQFVQPTLPYTADRNAPCPFADDICKSQTGNIRLDSGLVDSHWDLGLNAPADKRIQLRQIMECAPLKTEGYVETQVYQNKSLILSIPYREYFYGPTVLMGNSINFTHHEKFFHWDQILYEARIADQSSYGLQDMGAYANDYNNMSSFMPIPALQRDNADVHILFLAAKDILYTGPIDDPWFAAHQANGFIATIYDTQTAYQPDEPASPLGCALQYQVCLPQSSKDGKCSEVGGINQVEAWLDQGDKNFNMTYALMGAASLDETEMRPLIASLGSSVLQAKYSLYESNQAALPNNQWQIESERIFSIKLAGMQASVVDVATGPADEEMQLFFKAPENIDQAYFCHNQKIRSAAYANFSVFGIAFTFAVGGAFIILSWTIEDLYSFYLKRWQPESQYRCLEWTVNGTLQLQRLAYEGLGHRTWTRCDKDHPVADRDQTLEILDVEDLKHPRLSRPDIYGTHGWLDKEKSLEC